ncbi:ATP-binding protein [Paractinoplanes atraurantiacus]|uniref:ATP-binding protein n=1 Tax=Paractinoplanes atraurantiacus TaxID=1036182 RepID=UPI001FE44F0C|nr:ATP-binding protein [Actinoplanes atraurantiacus]
MEKRGLVLAVIVALVGLVIFGLVYVGMRTAQDETAERVMDQRTAMAQAAVETETERFRALTEATAAGLGTDDDLTWADFDAATAPLSSADLIGAASLAFVVPATTAEIPSVQKLWRDRGSDGLQLKPVGSGEHYFSVYTRTLNSAGPALNGLDVSAAPEAAAALQDARRIGQPSVSDTYVLLRDRNLPTAQQQHSFLFAAPVWSRAPVPSFRGWMVLGLRGQDFLSGVLATVSQGQLDATLLAADRDGDRPVVADYSVGGDADLERRGDFTVADRQWTLITRADAKLLPGATSPLPLSVLLGGIAVSLILAGLVHTLATGQARALAKVEEGTAELRDAEAESRRQAGLLGAIMNSIGDGVGVVDEHGAFLLHNPAARQLLGGMDDAEAPDDWQQHYGIYRPDGRTPFPLDELPLMRALRGELSDGVEMVIRNPRRPEGILLSVDGRPLHTSAGQRGAVAVFHDITELRRYESDLAVFAGVVAHDLKAPLAVIRGHCEAAIEDLADVPPSDAGEDVRDSLQRIVRAVDRMGGLIDTLLAYSTARNAPLRTRPVDLGALLAEVIRDRVEHLRAEQRPDVYVGPMPEVSADPAMLRHVLDNLVGNALKYVRPGTTPRVDVTGEVAGERWARVEIADRGIGIPDEDKPQIFESFHRAQSAAGYAGTGLGLAICKRIVERHGGEIGVADNPGGGTRFHFTIPVPTEGGSDMSKAETDEEAATRAALERALAERAAMENTRLPGLGALPSSVPSGHNPAAVPLRAPVPERPPATAE